MIPEFRALLARWDVVILQETFLIPDQEVQLLLPTGYNCFACSRPCSDSLNNQRGGVLVMYRTDLPVPVRMASPSLPLGSDFMLLYIGDVLLVNVYLPPAGSPWCPVPNVTPEQRLLELLLPHATSATPLVLMGDFNARMGSRYNTLSRSSPDERVLQRGNAVLDMCEELDLEVLNGTSYHAPDSRDSYTSFQLAGCSVIDLAILSQSLLAHDPPPIFHVLPHCAEWSDHSPITLTLSLVVASPESSAVPPPSCRVAQTRPVIPAALPPVDVKLREVLQHVAPSSLQELYGRVWAAGQPLDVHLSASIWVNSDGQPVHMGAGAYAGPSHALSRPLSVPGIPSRPRAIVAAALHVLISADPTRTLRIWCDDPFLAHAVCHWALHHASRSWRCPHGDLLQTLARVLRMRPAPVTFHLVDSERRAENTRMRHAADLADEALAAAQQPTAEATTVQPCLASTEDVPCHWLAAPRQDDQYLSYSKVHTPLPPVSVHAVISDESPSETTALDDLLIDGLEDLPAGTHGVRRTNLRAVLFASTEASFWPAFRAFTCDKPRPARVTLLELQADFRTRMNPPAILPAEFNELERALNRITARSLPRCTVDTTPARSFSRPFSLEEIDSAKQHIRSHNLQSAQGPDAIEYRAVLDCPSEELRELFQLCVDTCTAPQDWLNATVAAIKKPRKDGSVPEHYRTIGLESCALKTLTLLIERRLREWAADTNRIPPSQSGFRKLHRTQNPAFVLRALIEKARAMGRSLLVVFLDLKNAFPSVDQPTLWAKLARWGANGPLLDWLRMLYSHLAYTVRFQGQTSDDVFGAAAGILIGDPASPILWLLFISDFDLPADPSDITLDGVPVSHQWLADDAMLASTITVAAQDKLDYFEQYCGDNSLTPSIPKTYAALYGPVPVPAPVLTLQRKPLAWVELATYTGVTVTSTARNIFKPHYVAKEKAARKVANGALALQQFIGPIPPPIALRMYRALVEPHLTYGCEICIDVQPSVLEPLEKVELAFLRRVLSLGTQCQRAPLYLETGLWPLRYRRLFLALRYLHYILTDGPEYLRAAYRDGFALANRSPELGGPAPSWWSDLYLALVTLPVPVHTFELNRAPTPERVRECLLQLECSLFDSFTHTVLNSDRLLAHRARLRRPQPPASLRAFCAPQPYLSLPNARLRGALVRLVCSEHPLAVEVLRRLPEGEEVPRNMRACRFCRRRGSVEDEPHALLGCSAPALRALRATFNQAGDSLSPMFKHRRQCWTGWRLLDFIFTCEVLLRPFAEFVLAVFHLCDDTPPLVLRDLITYCSSTVP